MAVRIDHLLYWVVPGVLAGMPAPLIHPARRRDRGGDLLDRVDHLPPLYAAGIRGFVSMLDDATDAPIYLSAGFEFLHLPVLVDKAPTLEQAAAAVAFIDRLRAKQRAVAVYCLAGLGRTGTLLAAYLIAQGETVDGALARVRKAQAIAVETPQQKRFLQQFAAAGAWPTVRVASSTARGWSLAG